MYLKFGKNKQRHITVYLRVTEYGNGFGSCTLDMT